MPTLIDVARDSRVTLLTAYHALSHAYPVDESVRRAVLAAATQLGYRLNITIRDVAHQAEVSIATVSYVLNDSYPVSPATRHRVLEAASALGYRPNSTARNLQASETRLIGYAWHDVLPGHVNMLLDRFMYWMAQAAEAHGYHVLTFFQPPENVTRTYDELIRTNRVDGFIISNTNREDPRIEHLIRAGVPFAAFGRSNDAWDFPYVDVDGRRGIELAVEHLLERGHRRIAILGWPEGSLSGDDRLRGYLDALRNAGIAPRPEWVIRTENSNQYACEATRQLLALAGRNLPTAIICLSDNMALGAMSSIHSAGLSVGRDLALTGFDDDPTSALLHPPLTSLRQPVDQIVASVVELLIAEINGTPAPNRHMLLAPSLIIRDSSNRYFEQP